MHYLLAQLIATGAFLFWSFVGNRFRTFGGESPQDAGG